MCELTIPSSPSWYLSNILACDDEGTVIGYGAKHELVIIKQDPNFVKPCDFQPKFIPMGHKDKINCVSFSPADSEYKNHVVSCSDDGSVHLWDWQTQTLISSHSGHPDEQIVGVDWSRADPNLVVSVSGLGSIVSWDLLSNTIRKFQIGTKIFPICIACCPHNKELIGIGARSGLVIIYSIKGDGFMNFRLRGHDSDVVSLAWCPVSHNIFHKDEDPKITENTYLLASGSKSRSIYFWRAGTDGRYESFLNLPVHPIASTGYRSKNGVGGPGNNWICVRWPSPMNIVTSSLFGELLSYDLKEFSIENPKDPNSKKSKSKFMRLVHGNHTKGLFSIAVPSKPLNGSERTVWTYALDKHLVACKLETGKVITDITTIGGIVYCMAVSPFDPNRIAIGTGDNKILVWNMSNDSYNDITSHWNKINSKVMAVAWHPEHESLLAFGTGEGRIGILDTTESTPTLLLRHHHYKSVYSLTWAPPVIQFEGPGKSNMALYSVGDGDILQYDIENAEKEPHNLASFFKKCDSSAKVKKSLGRTDLAWKHDWSLAAVGNGNGALYIVNGSTFEQLHTVFAHKKLIQCIVWHPDTVTSENSVSPYSSWLASASDNIQIMNVTNEGVETVACLNTHHEKVVSLAWSPHFNARLVSASYDYTSQVWDVISGSVLACFDGHHCSVVCCLPSSIHQDCYITGSADNTIRVWNMNKYNLIKSKSKKQRISGVLKKLSAAQEAKDLTVTEPGEKTSLNHSDEPTQKSNKKENHQKSEKVMVAETIPKAHKSKSMFPVTSSGISGAKRLDILWDRLNGIEPNCKTPGICESGYLDFFGTSKCIRRLMMVEENNHRDVGNEQHARHLSLWSGNLNQVIIDACRKKRLDSWLVSLAPMVSHKLWVDCCKTYAQQLADSGETHMAVSYLLGVHQIEEAIDLLLDAKLHREAIAIAKSRFLPDDPIIRKVLMHWANHCVGNGMLSLAAHCLLNCGSYIEAVELLARSKDGAMLALAAEIAHKSEAFEMALSLAMRAINTSLENNDYQTALLTVMKHSTLKDLVLWINICNLIKEWNHINVDYGTSWICGKGSNGDNIFEKSVEMCNKLVPSYSVLSKFLPNKPTPDSEDKMWSYICGQLSLAVAANMQPSNTKCVLKHIIQALDCAYNFYLHNPSNYLIYLQLSVWLLPNGPFSNSSLYANFTQSQKECVQIYISCSVIYWLDILNTKNSLPYEDKETMSVLSDTVVRCAFLLFSKDILKYHIIDVEIKKLENSIAAAKLKALNAGKVLKHCKDIEAQLQNGSSEEVSGDNKDSNKQEDEDHAKRLSVIKGLKSKFEEERFSVPNPFITFCTLRNSLQSISSKNCDLIKDTLNTVTKLWNCNSSTDDQ